MVPSESGTVAALMRRLTGVAITRCPVGRVQRLLFVAHLPPEPLAVPVWDTS